MSPTHKIKQLEKIYLLGNKTAQAFLESTVSKVITPNEVSERFRMATVPRWLRIFTTLFWYDGRCRFDFHTGLPSLFCAFLYLPKWHKKLNSSLLPEKLAT